MDKKIFLNQWTKNPIPNDPVVDAEKRKAKAGLDPF